MQAKKWFFGLLATIFTLSLTAPDLALAQGRGRGMGPGAGSGSCPMYQGQGMKRGQGRRQRLRDGSGPNNPASQPPVVTPTPAPSN